jgi:hypothetical protein
LEAKREPKRSSQASLILKALKEGAGAGNDEESSNDEPKDRSDHLRAKRMAFKKIAKGSPGKLTMRGLEHMMEFIESHLGEEQGEQLRPIVLRYLLSVYIPNHPVKAIGDTAYRELRTLAESMDHMLKGNSLCALDMLMQRFKAITVAIKDHSWRSARWLELIPTDADGAATTVDEDELIRQVESGELKIRELVSKFKGSGSEIGREEGKSQYPFSDGQARSGNMERAAASVDSRTAAIVSAEALDSAQKSVKRLSLMQAASAVQARPRPEVVLKSARRMNPAAKAKITNFKNLREEMPRSEDESRKTYRARLGEKLKAKRAVFKEKGKGGATSAGSPAVLSL